MYRIKSVVEIQKRLNPNMKEVISIEILKWVNTGIIFLISNSDWISPIHIVPKKGKMTLIVNENDEIIPTKIIMHGGYILRSCRDDHENFCG